MTGHGRRPKISSKKYDVDDLVSIVPEVWICVATDWLQNDRSDQEISWIVRETIRIRGWYEMKTTWPQNSVAPHRQPFSHTVHSVQSLMTPGARTSQIPTYAMEASPFHSALQALFGSDPAQQAHSNAWLTAFAPTPGAWQEAATLADPACPAEVGEAWFHQAQGSLALPLTWPPSSPTLHARQR